MRLDPVGYDEEERVIGAIVVRATSEGRLTIDLGPADGAPLVQIELTNAEARNVANALHHAQETGEESVIIADN